MKASEVRELTTAELESKLKDLKAELFNLRFQLAINQLDNPMRISAVKKDIARVRPFCVKTKSKTALMRNGRED
jgi:large subunit ribosomal protein L29